MRTTVQQSHVCAFRHASKIDKDQLGGFARIGDSIRMVEEEPVRIFAFGAFAKLVSKRAIFWVGIHLREPVTLAVRMSAMQMNTLAESLAQMQVKICAEDAFATIWGSANKNCWRRHTIDDVKRIAVNRVCIMASNNND